MPTTRIMETRTIFSAGGRPPHKTFEPHSLEQKWYHGCPLAGVVLSKLLFVCAMFFGSPAHHLCRRHRPKQPCYVWQRSQHSVLNKAMTGTYLPRSPTYTQLRPKRCFRRSSLETRPTQTRIHAELRAFLSPADADCAKSDECSGWITPRTRTWIDIWTACTSFEHVLARYRHTSRGTAD